MRPSVSYSGTVYFTFSLPFFCFFRPFAPLPSIFWGTFPSFPFFLSFFVFFLCFLSFPLPSLPFGICSPLLFPLFSPFPFVLVSFVCNIYYGVSFQFPPFFFIFPFFLKKSRFFFCCCWKSCYLCIRFRVVRGVSSLTDWYRSSTRSYCSRLAPLGSPPFFFLGWYSLCFVHSCSLGFSKNRQWFRPFAALVFRLGLCFGRTGMIADDDGVCRTLSGQVGEDICLFLQCRVWSWLRMNASYRLNTCKSRGSMRFACKPWWRPAHGCVTRIQPSSY